MKYKSNYITHAICRINFPNILDFNQFNPPKSFQKDVSSDFPLTDVQDSDTSDDAKEWVFSDKKNTKIVAISNTYLQIEYTKYTTFERFYEGIKKIINTFTDLYHVKHIITTELRYINEIILREGNTFDWKNIIDDKLLFNSSNFVDESHSILRSMQTFEFMKNDNRIIFTFGTPNSEYPEPISRKEFLLDYNVSYDDLLEISDVFDKIKEFNEIISDMFENSIGDELRAKMGVIEND